jgi:putative Mg2+ transporter-C (MgtC) family protein
VTHHNLALLGHVAVALGLCFVLGFEREVRGADAGDRTFSLVGVASAAITAVAVPTSPNAIAGVITGIGFIGGGLLYRAAGMLKGLTTAAAIWVAAAIGVVAGLGYVLLATILTVLVLIDLEIRYVPMLRALDARRWRGRFMDDMQPPTPMVARHTGQSPPPEHTPPPEPWPDDGPSS